MSLKVIGEFLVTLARFLWPVCVKNKSEKWGTVMVVILAVALAVGQVLSTGGATMAPDATSQAVEVQTDVLETVPADALDAGPAPIPEAVPVATTPRGLDRAIMLEISPGVEVVQ